MRIAFSTLSCPDWTWNRILECGPRFGYDGVELRLLERDTDLLNMPLFQPSQLEARRRELAAAGFQVCGLASSVRFDYPERRQRDEQIEIGRRFLDLAAALGASFVRVFGDAFPEHADAAAQERTIQQVVEGLGRLGEYAASLQQGVIIETHGDFSDSRVMRKTLSQIDSPAVGVLWDTHHPWRFYGEPLEETIERLKPWIRHTHWKDSVTRPAPRENDPQVQQAATQAHSLMSGHRHADYVLFGGGEFPAETCLHLLDGIGYGGWFSLEWEKMWHPELEDPEVALPLFPHKLRRLAQIVQNTPRP